MTEKSFFASSIVTLRLRCSLLHLRSIGANEMMDRAVCVWILLVRFSKHLFPTRKSMIREGASSRWFICLVSRPFYSAYMGSLIREKCEIYCLSAVYLFSRTIHSRNSPADDLRRRGNNDVQKAPFSWSSMPPARRESVHESGIRPISYHNRHFEIRMLGYF